VDFLENLPDWSCPGMIRNDQQDFSILKFGWGHARPEDLFHLLKRKRFLSHQIV
jgi:hypothetical protein